MSLTTEPRNTPYEQPPLHNTSEEVLAFYFQKLDDEEVIDDMMFVLEEGFPLESLVDSMLSVGAMEGYHSIDAKILVAPILHEYLFNLAQAAGVEVIEFNGPSKEDRMKEKEKSRMKSLIQKALEEGEEEAPSEENIMKAEEALATEGEGPSPSLIKRRE